MKKTIFTFLGTLTLMFFLNQAFAQVPQGFNYQAVARNSSGTLIQNQALGVELIIHQGSAGGTIIYSERQTPTTNQFGLFTISVGQGTFLSGNAFNTINWSTGDYWLEVGLDVAGGTAYVSMGTSQLLTVPYAMYSANSGAAIPIGTSGQTLRHDGTSWVANDFLYNNGTNIGIGTTTPSNGSLHLNTGIYSAVHFTNTITGALNGNGCIVGTDYNLADMILWNYELAPIKFGTSGTERMRIMDDGKIGIGTQTPSALLHVEGAGPGLTFPAIYANNTDPAGIGLLCAANSTDATAVFVQSNSASGLFAKFFDGGASDLIRFDNDQTNHRGKIMSFSNNIAGSTGAYSYAWGGDAGGWIIGGISTAAVDQSIIDLYMTTTGTGVFEPWDNNITSCGSASYKWTAVYATNGTIQTSDETKKENIMPVSYGLNEVMKLKPVSYQWKDKKALVGNGISLGFIAQDLENIIPDVVVHSKLSDAEIESLKKNKGGLPETDTYGVKYSELTPVLVKAIQDQQKIIEDLQKQINELKNR
jgi:hypothetical protein